jgi:hypothetical protein
MGFASGATLEGKAGSCFELEIKIPGIGRLETAFFTDVSKLWVRVISRPLSTVLQLKTKRYTVVANFTV